MRHQTVRPVWFVLIGLGASLDMFSCSSVPQATTAIAQEHAKYVIVTADDFGASENVDEGIEFAAAQGAITGVSVLANMAGSAKAVSRLSHEFPELGIGVHLNLTTGKPILHPSEISTIVDQEGAFLPVARFYAGIKDISEFQVERELTVQIEAVRSAGVRIDHLSDHNGILSIYPPFYEIMVRLALRYHVALRSPVAAGIEYPKIFPGAVTRQKSATIAREAALLNLSGPLSLLKYTGAAEFREKMLRLDRLGVVHPDLLVDYFYGRPTIENALYILRNLPDRTSEIVVHLGNSRRQSIYPNGLDTSYFDDRERELAVVTSAYLREYARTINLSFIRFSDLSRVKSCQ